MRENILPKWVYLDSRKLAQIANSDPDTPSLKRFVIIETIEWTCLFLFLFILYRFISSFWDYLTSFIRTAGFWVLGVFEYSFDLVHYWIWGA